MTALTAELIVDRLDPRDVAVSGDGRLIAFVAAPVGPKQEREGMETSPPSQESRPAATPEQRLAPVFADARA